MITAALILALVAAAATIAWQHCVIIRNLNTQLADIRNNNCGLVRHNGYLRSSLSDAHAAMNRHDVTYYTTPCTDGKAYAVIRRCFINDTEYHTFIKSFHDTDPDFNLREAEELCEILNS